MGANLSFSLLLRPQYNHKLTTLFFKQKCPKMAHKANCAIPIIFGIDNKLILIHIGFHRNGEKKEAIGDAYIPDPSYPSRLGVRFSNRKLNLQMQFFSK